MRLLDGAHGAPRRRPRARGAEYYHTTFPLNAAACPGQPGPAVLTHGSSHLRLVCNRLQAPPPATERMACHSIQRCRVQPQEILRGSHDLHLRCAERFDNSEAESDLSLKLDPPEPPGDEDDIEDEEDEGVERRRDFLRCPPVFGRVVETHVSPVSSSNH